MEHWNPRVCQAIQQQKPQWVENHFTWNCQFRYGEVCDYCLFSLGYFWVAWFPLTLRAMPYSSVEFLVFWVLDICLWHHHPSFFYRLAPSWWREAMTVLCEFGRTPTLLFSPQWSPRGAPPTSSLGNRRRHIMINWSIQQSPFTRHGHVLEAKRGTPLGVGRYPVRG